MPAPNATLRPPPEMRFDPVAIRVLGPRLVRPDDEQLLNCRWWIVASGVLLSASFLSLVLLAVVLVLFCRRRIRSADATAAAAGSKSTPTPRPYAFAS